MSRMRYKALSEKSVLEFNELAKVKMGMCKDISDFNKVQFATARKLGESISKTAGLVRCFWNKAASTFQRWPGTIALDSFASLAEFMP